MMNDDDDDVMGIDLDAWQPPPPPAGIADGVLARMRQEVTQVTTQALPVEPGPPIERRSSGKRWWIAGGVTLAAAATTLVAFGMTRAPASGEGNLVAARPAHLALGPSSADLDERTVVTWRRDRHRVTAQQAGGAATWRVDDDDSLTIETALGSIEATNASLRVEVKMIDEKRTIALSAVTAAAVAVVTIVVYEGTVKIREANQPSQQVLPGTAYQIRAKGDNVIVEDQLHVGAGPVIAVAPSNDEMRLKLESLEDQLQQKERELEELKRTTSGYDPFASARPLDAGVDRSNIDRAMKGLSPKIKACGETYSGKVMAHVRVEPDGRVTTATVEPADAKPAACVAEVLRAATFPPSKTGTTIKYPFTFVTTYEFSGNPVTKPGCDAYALIEKGKSLFASGNNAAAMTAFEASVACKSDPQALKLVVVAACRAHDLTTARKYWKRLDDAARNSILSVCVQSGYENPDLMGETDQPARLRLTNSKPAKVLIDGVEVGITPIDIEVPPGRHRLTLVVGSDKHTFSVELGAGATVALSKDIQ